MKNKVWVYFLLLLQLLGGDMCGLLILHVSALFAPYQQQTEDLQKQSVLVLLPSMELKMVCTLLCSLLISAALHLPQHASGRISGCNLGKKAEVSRSVLSFRFIITDQSLWEKLLHLAQVVHATAKGLTVEVSSVGTEHKYEDEGGLIFYNADYSLATTHAPPLPKHHP